MSNELKDRLDSLRRDIEYRDKVDAVRAGDPGRCADSEAAADERVREACAGERSAIVAWLLRCAKGHTKHAAALRADAGTQADTEARGCERIASVLTDAARSIGEGRHWR